MAEDQGTCGEMRCYLALVCILVGAVTIVLGSLSITSEAYSSGSLIGVGCAAFALGVVSLVIVFLRTCLFPVRTSKKAQQTLAAHPLAPGTHAQLILMPGQRPALLLSPKAGTKPEFVFIWLHGNAMTVSDCIPLCQCIADCTTSAVLIPEYPGYDAYVEHHRWSSPSQSGVNQVARVAFEYCQAVLKCSASRIVIVGHSIGTGPAAWLSARRSCGGLVLISPYEALTDIIEHVVRFYTWSPLAKIAACLVTPCAGWSPAREVAKSTCPVLLLHGALDLLISYRHSVNILNNVVTPPVTKVTADKLVQHGRMWLRVSSMAGHADWTTEPDIVFPIAAFTAASVDLTEGDPPQIPGGIAEVVKAPD
ncbi:putative alpha/beta hydrolase [Diplonema papillatum]|nr:putative alpha/beta hydrolase [Diplonema papillatum]|eukprot:gene1626-2432_t